MPAPDRRVARIDGVLLSPADAGYLAEALDLFETLARQFGSRPTPQLLALRSALAAAAGASRSAAAASDFRAAGVGGASSERASYIDTNEAGRILGCTPGNARDLARRGTIPGIRAGGRWLLDAAAVHARAAGW